MCPTPGTLKRKCALSVPPGVTLKLKCAQDSHFIFAPDPTSELLEQVVDVVFYLVAEAIPPVPF